MKIKSSVIIIFFPFLSHFVWAQCNIKKEDADENLLLVAQSEKIYQNEDLENGLKVVFAHFFLAVNKEEKEKVKFSLSIIYAKTKRQESLVPRMIKFYFSDGDIISLNADEFDSPILNGIRAERCFFRMSLADVEKMKSKSVDVVEVVDTRTNANLSTRPYFRLFSEQIDCLLKKHSEL